MQSLIISTLAEYQTAFWVPVAQMLEANGYPVTLVSFDTRSTAMVRAANLDVIEATLSAREAALGGDDPRTICAGLGIDNPGPLLTHERFAFAMRDTDHLLRKLAGSAILGKAAITRARAKGEPVLLQELGGFLSVLGLHHAALHAGVPSLFIEPSFFKGRMQMVEGSLGALRLERGARAPVEDDLAAYFEEALTNNTIVIPQKDRRHYSAAAAKLTSGHNIKRLIEKSRDKYLLGAEQEFGAIGHHVRTHLKMLGASLRLRGAYTQLKDLGSFIYYPLHVPGDVALTVRSPQYLDQLALLDFICRHAPPDVTIATKEHPAMIGAVPSAGLLALKARYDRFAILPPATNNYTVLSGADRIVTVNSKSGAEAGLLGKDVIVLGDAFYREAPFAQALDNLDQLGAALTAAPVRSPQSQGQTMGFFAALWARTYPGELYVADDQSVARFTASLRTALIHRTRHTATSKRHMRS